MTDSKDLATQGDVSPISTLLANPEALRDIPIETMERVIKLDRELRAEKSERVYAIAFKAAQDAISPIKKRGWNPSTKSTFARAEDVSSEIDPIVSKHGFSQSTSMGECPISEHVRIVLTVRHTGGHRETHFFDAPIDTVGMKGQKNKTALHGASSSWSYAERILKLHVWGAETTTMDDDGNAGAGLDPSAEKITQDQADDLEALRQEVKADGKRLLSALGVEKLSDLPKSRYTEAVRMLEAKR